MPDADPRTYPRGLGRKGQRRATTAAVDRSDDLAWISPTILFACGAGPNFHHLLNCGAVCVTHPCGLWLSFLGCSPPSFSAPPGGGVVALAFQQFGTETKRIAQKVIGPADIKLDELMLTDKPSSDWHRIKNALDVKMSKRKTTNGRPHTHTA